MYEAFFDLRESPFSLTPDPRFLWLSETHEEGLSTLIYGITRRKGFILLTGEVGAGKTTLLRAALDRVAEDLADSTETGIIMNTADLKGIDLLKLIAAEFQISSHYYQNAEPPQTTADFIIGLNSFLIDRMQDGRNTVLIIDEAQNLDLEALEQVRLLSNLETDTQKLLQIVLTGQPELRDKLADPRLRQLRQRVAIEHHVAPLPRDQIAKYLAHRIKVAGGVYEKIFEPGADEIFYAFSGGCPRLINLLGDRVLLAAFSKTQCPVPNAAIAAKVAEMGAYRPAEPADDESRAKTLPGARLNG